MDAARILTQPVDARAPDGKTVKLHAIEAAYLSLCKRGLKGHKTSLLEAIRIMLEVGPAINAQRESEEAARQDVFDQLEKMGVNIRGDS